MKKILSILSAISLIGTSTAI
ncbi:lipoprotein [Spiroplasma endosymbiont of Polydrusus pterygomalis]